MAISYWYHTLLFPKIGLQSAFKKKWKYSHILHYKDRKKSNFFDF